MLRDTEREARSIQRIEEWFPMQMQSPASPGMPERKEPHTAGTGAFWAATSAKPDDLKMSKGKKENGQCQCRDPWRARLLLVSILGATSVPCGWMAITPTLINRHGTCAAVFPWNPLRLVFMWFPSVEYCGNLSTIEVNQKANKLVRQNR